MNDYRNKYGNDYVSTGSWMLYVIVSIIPGLNLLVWLFSLGSRKKSKRTFAGACLILFLLVVLIAAAAYVTMCYTDTLKLLNEWLQSFIPRFPEIPKLLG